MSEKVEAVVIEEQNGLSVSFSPASITANFKALNERVDELLSAYDAEIDITDKEQIKTAKHDRAYLNSIAKEIDERRKAIKREYEKPLKDFESQVATITSKIKEISSQIDAKVKEAEQIAKDRKEGELQEHYEAYAGLLAPVVPFSRLMNPKWLNKSFNIVKAKEELEAKVDKVASDWESLKKLNLDFYDMAEANFFETLDIASAIAYNDKLVSDRQKIEEMKAEIEEEPVEAIPETPIQEIPQAPIPVAPILDAPVEIPCAWVVVIPSATTSQAREAGKILGSVGITGSFKRGTLAEVYAREVPYV